MVRRFLPVMLALGCGPIAGLKDVPVDEESTSTTSTSDGSYSASYESETSGEPTGSDGLAACPAVTVEAPFAYRGYCLGEGSSLPGAVGRFGISGEPRFAFIGGKYGTLWDGTTTLFGWDGVQLSEERFALVEYAAPWLPAVLGDPSRDDLVGDALEDEVQVIPNSPQGLQAPVSTAFSPSSRSPIAAIDLDGDGLDELVAGYSDGLTPTYLKAYRWTGVSWAWWANLDVVPNGCSVHEAKRMEIDGDARPDLVIVSMCGSGTSASSALVTMTVTPRPLQFETRLWPGQEGWVPWWHTADFDGDGMRDLVYELVDDGPRRLEVVLVPGDGSLVSATTLWLDNYTVFVDGDYDCIQTSHEWIPVEADGDGRSELMCGRTMLTSILDAPTSVEALAPEPFGGRVGPDLVAHDLNGDGIDEIALSGRDTAGEPRVFLLISGT